MSPSFSSALVLAAISVACGGGEAPGGPSASYQLPTTVGSAPQVKAIPYPNELFAPTAGEADRASEILGFSSSADADAVANLYAALVESPCAAPTTAVTFPIEIEPFVETIDEATVTGDSVVLVDLESGQAIATRKTVRQSDGAVVIEPERGVALLEGHRYGAYMTTAIRTGDGEAVRASAAFARVRRGDPDDDVEAQAATSLTPLFDVLDPELELAVATVFETCAVGADLETIHAEITSAAAPSASLGQLIGSADLDALLGAASGGNPGIDNIGGPLHDALAAVVQGTFDASSYIAATAATQGRFERGADGAPMVKGAVPLAFTLALPIRADYTDTPVVIFMHGLGGDTTELFAIANQLAAAGFASIAIDLPLHGARFPSADDRKHNFTGADGPDGFADAAGANAPLYFFDVITQPPVTFLDPRVMRDHFRQGAVDVFSLVRLLADGDWSAVAAADPSLATLGFDPDRIVFASESFGGFVGVPVLAFEPRLRGGFLSVAGGGLTTELLESSAVYGPLFGPLIAGAYAVPRDRLDPELAPIHTHLVYQLLTNALSQAEPISYAGRVATAGTPVVLPTANLDESVPNRSSEALAATLGLAFQPELGEIDAPQWLAADAMPIAAPSAIVGVTFTREPATHGMLTRARGERRFERDGEYFVPLDPPQLVSNPTGELQTLLVDAITAMTE